MALTRRKDMEVKLGETLIEGGRIVACPNECTHHTIAARDLTFRILELTKHLNRPTVAMTESTRNAGVLCDPLIPPLPRLPSLHHRRDRLIQMPRQHFVVLEVDLLHCA